jgi:hypothetical protein
MSLRVVQGPAEGLDLVRRISETAAFATDLGRHRQGNVCAIVRSAALVGVLRAVPARVKVDGAIVMCHGDASSKRRATPRISLCYRGSSCPAGAVSQS